MRVSKLILAMSCLTLTLTMMGAPASARSAGTHGSRADHDPEPRARREVHDAQWGRWHGRHNPGANDPGPTVIVSGLNNPRQLSLNDRELLIAEAGKGGTACSGTGQDETCVGNSGAVSFVNIAHPDPAQKPFRVLSGFLSGAGPDGSFAVGSDGVSTRSLWGPIDVQETFAPPDVIPAGLPGDQSGKLLRGRLFSSTISTVADISGFEQAHDPDGQGVDSDPYAVLAAPGGDFVADAAGNDILWVKRDGTVSLFHVFPNVVNATTTTATADFPGYDPTPAFPGADFVPTSLALGPWGQLFVGGLSSELPGQAEVVELDWSGNVVNTWTGFTTITGVAVGRDGSLYVSQLEAPQANPVDPNIVGVVTKVARDGTRTDKDVPFPAGVAVDGFNNVYVAAFSIAPDSGLAGAPAGVDTSGQVWRMRF